MSKPTRKLKKREVEKLENTSVAGAGLSPDTEESSPCMCDPGGHTQFVCERIDLDGAVE